MLALEGMNYEPIWKDNTLRKPRQRRLAVGMVTDFVSFIYNLKAVL